MTQKCKNCSHVCAYVIVHNCCTDWWRVKHLVKLWARTTWLMESQAPRETMGKDYLTDGRAACVSVCTRRVFIVTTHPFFSVRTWRLVELRFLNEAQHRKCFVRLNRHNKQWKILSTTLVWIPPLYQTPGVNIWYLTRKFCQIGLYK